MRETKSLKCEERCNWTLRTTPRQWMWTSHQLRDGTGVVGCSEVTILTIAVVGRWVLRGQHFPRGGSWVVGYYKVAVLKVVIHSPKSRSPSMIRATHVGKVMNGDEQRFHITGCCERFRRGCYIRALDIFSSIPYLPHVHIYSWLHQKMLIMNKENEEKLACEFGRKEGKKEKKGKASEINTKTPNQRDEANLRHYEMRECDDDNAKRQRSKVKGGMWREGYSEKMRIVAEARDSAGVCMWRTWRG